MLRFLVDECVDRRLVDALAAAGHELKLAPTGLADQEIVALANADGRLVLTQDYDFGEMAVRHGYSPRAVVMVACQTLAPAQRYDYVAAKIAELAASLDGRLTTIRPQRVRQRELRNDR
jgi:predicted nuclease of predicted toxin-antitoxin system